MLTPHFKLAANDYLYLSERNYPLKSSLKLVSDKYKLSGEERSMLFRGVAIEAVIKKRNSKIIQNPDPDGDYMIDGYNVIRTIGSYLIGNLVFVSMDGFLRDASEIHKKSIKEDVTYKAIDLILRALKNMKAKSVLFLLDKPISKSGELAKHINSELDHISIKGEAKTVHSPDYHLKKAKSAVICTSDSTIIDECRCQVLDFARYILDVNYSTDFLIVTNF